MDVPSQLPPRPAPSKAGNDIKMGLNVFKVTKMPTDTVYQFEVLIGSGEEKRGLIKRVWESNAVQNELGRGWIFDCKFWVATSPNFD